MNARGSQDTQPSDNPSSGSSSRSHSERERIRSRMKMVIGQLEGILQELKEVAKELREVNAPGKAVAGLGACGLLQQTLGEALVGLEQDPLGSAGYMCLLRAG